MTVCAACGKSIKDGITVWFKDILGKRVFFHFNYECESDGRIVHCPECGYPIAVGDTVTCANCGFAAHADFWLTLEITIREKFGKLGGMK